MLVNEKEKRIVIVDTRLFAYHTFHSKKHILNMLINIADVCPHDDYTKLVFVFDVGKSKFHTDIYPAYKAHRRVQQEKQSNAEKERLEVFNKEYYKLLEILPYFGTVIGIPTYEADSLANILVETFAPLKGKYTLTLLTSDSDWLVHLTDTVEQVTNTGKIITEESLVEYKGYTTKQLKIFKNLVGEAKDNILGVYRMGEKALDKIFDKVGDDLEAVLKEAQNLVDNNAGGAKLRPDYPKEGFTFATVKDMYDFNEVLNTGITLGNIPKDDLEEIRRQFNVPKQKISSDDLSVLVMKEFVNPFFITDSIKYFYRLLGV